MRADNSHHLIQATARRSHDARQRATEAITQKLQRGEPVTFLSVAKAAGVSKAYLYGDAVLRAQIEAARARTRTATPVPPAQRASDPSLLRRLELAHARNRELTHEVEQLRAQLARAYGDRRMLSVAGPRPEQAEGQA